MKKKFLLFFNNLSFRKKIGTICTLISLVPMLLFGTVSYGQISSQMVRREENNLNETLQQTAASIDYRLNAYMDALNMVLWNETVKTALVKTYETNYDLYMFYKYNIDSLFLAVRSLNTDIDTVTIYTDAKLNPHGNSVMPLDSARDMPWYDRALQTTLPFYQVSDDGSTLYLTGQMYYRYDAPVSVVCLFIDMDSLSASSQKLVQGNYRFLLTDENGETVYETSSFPEDPFYPALTVQELENGGIPSLYIDAHCPLNEGTWTAWLYRPSDEVLKTFRHFQITALFLAVMCISASFLAVGFLSRIVSQPLERLSENIQLVEQGRYEIISESTPRKDEVGRLQNAFGDMVKQLDHMINEVLLAQIRQQKYELRILQAQINPHFLYNSLSLINVQAIMAGQSGISQLSQLLSTFYRTMLNKGKNMTTIRDELENTRAYVSIQQIMHSYSFDVTYDIDERALPFSVLNLIIQPLAENAILHGLDHRRAPGKGMLTVTCRLDGDDILFQVIDNGCGMSEEDCRQILTTDSRGYGVKNVHKRIQLYYGEAYGLRYRSTPGSGTCALLRLKKCSEEQENMLSGRSV